MESPVSSPRLTKDKNEAWQPGTEYVKTFYPMPEEWFQKHADLETILKDNPTFSLKELANFHVQAVINAKR